jgi:hypothetical protein
LKNKITCKPNSRTRYKSEDGKVDTTELKNSISIRLKLPQLFIPVSKIIKALKTKVISNGHNSKNCSLYMKETIVA